MVGEEREAYKKSDQSVLSHILGIRERMEEMTTVVQDDWKKLRVDRRHGMIRSIPEIKN